MYGYKKVIEKILYSPVSGLFFLAVFIEVDGKTGYNISYDILQFFQYRSAGTQLAYVVMCIAE